MARLAGRRASMVGDTRLLRYDPAASLRDAGTNVDLPLHEVVHFVSRWQTAELEIRSLTPS